MAMADIENPPPCLEERHLCASVTSNMLMKAHRNGQGDVVGAAGMAAQEQPAQLGLALVHLRAEWDRADKPHKRTAEWIDARKKKLEAEKARHPARQAQAEALVWHAGVMRARASTLTGRNAVMGLLGDWATFHGVDPTLLSPALFHWLAPNCPACDGHGRFRYLDAPGLSDKKCPHCRGTGKWPRPLGADLIHEHIQRCVGRLKKGMGEKLYG